jgi:hypothetical protein
MTEKDAIQIESSQRQHHEVLEHHSRLSFNVEREELCLFSTLKPKLSKDGNQWCVLYGENLQEGIAGFGDTPRKAITAWNAEWDKA